MKVKELQKTVNIAWSPVQQQPIYLAAGTAAQQFDSNANSTLEIYSTNLSDPSYDLELKSSLPSQYRYQKLIWSPTGNDGAHRNGLLVGGCEGGHIMIYSAAKLLANEEGLIARQDKHTGAVSGLDFNPFQTNLLASCASESEIFIWDLNNPTTHMNPGAKTQPLEDVKNVAWNHQVQHILASVFSSRCVIWDLRKSQQIIKLSDTQSRVRWHAIQWHPEVATQVWLASEDDQAPVVQLWDLRYATAPAKTYQIHQRGVLGMSWCPRDIDLMISCGKDNRIYCWNPNTEIPEGEILSEVATTTTWYSDVQWCPRNPALLASSSLDGNVSIYSLFGGTQQVVQTANKIADSFPGMDQFTQAPLSQQASQIVYHDLKRAPKWLKRSSGVAFGFGGKLVSFDAKSRSINISQVTTEPELVERANALERTLADANYADYCRQRADQMTDQNGRYLWYFIKANFEHNPKEEMLNLLGYNRDDVDNKFAKYVKDDESDAQQDIDQLTNRISTLTHSDSSEVECDQSTNCSTDNSQTLDNNAIFDGIAAAQQENDNAAGQLDVQPKPQFKIPSGEDEDSLISEAILTGNLEAAVELCLESQRIAEALIIASTAGIEFLMKIQNRYLQQQQKQSELSNVISALVTRDWLDFVNHCTVDSWKEALVAALKHSERKAVDICERLGDRLLQECASSVEYTRNAMLCYICAGSIDKLVSAWYQLKQLEQQNPNYKLNTQELQDLAEVVMLMSKSLEQQGIALDVTGRFTEFISEYGGLLAAQGALTAALAYIFALGANEQNTELETLRQRIYNTINYKASQTKRAYQQQRQPQQQQQQSNLYARPPPQQQPARGSFSQPSAVPLLPPQQLPLAQQPLGYPNSQQQPTPLNQYQANSWQSPAAPPPLPSAAASNAPSLFNPAQVGQALPPKPQQPDSQLTQPPRPPSNASSHGGSTSGAPSGLHARSKYLLDPSVAPAAPAPIGYGAAYNAMPQAPTPAAVPFTGAAPAANIPSPYNNNAFNTNPMAASGGALQPNATLLQPQPPQFNASPYGGATNSYLPGVPPIETAPIAAAPPLQSIQRNPTPPPGWNDPPALKSSRVPKKVEAANAAIASPITHPIFGADPNQNQNGYTDPNAYQSPQHAGMPPPPTSNVNSYYNPMVASNNNQMPPAAGYPQQQINFQTSAFPTNQQQPQQQQQQQWTQQQPQQYQVTSMGYTEQPAPIQRQPEPPKEKPPLPEEYVYLQTVLDELKTQCLNAASDPRTKRKFVDVAKRLEVLYDCLRDGRLAPTTIQYLNQIVQYIQIGDYANALEIHTRIAFGTDFSQCAGFMSGLKVLLQSAIELHIVLR